MVEVAMRFACAGESLFGILAVPAEPRVPGDRSWPATSRTAVVIVVGGPQYRSGSHRQFTLMARELAAAGWPTLRFDYRGMGDSTGPMRSFEKVSEDLGAAIGALQRELPDVDRVVLWGLCDGASAALLYLDDCDDPRIAGLCLVNPWARTEATLAATHVKHYYGQRLMQAEFWRKLASGGLRPDALAGLWRSVTATLGPRRDGLRDTVTGAPSFEHRMARAIQRFGGPLLLALSGNDLTAKEFVEYAGRMPAWQTTLKRTNCSRADFASADHTFSNPGAQDELNRTMVNWLRDAVGSC